MITIAIECEWPGCMSKIEHETTQGHLLDGMARLVSVASGWSLDVPRTEEMPSWVPARFNLCPIHRGAIL